MLIKSSWKRRRSPGAVISRRLVLQIGTQHLYLSPGTSSSYHYLRMTPEELKQLPPNQVLQACLEFRRLLQILTGILVSPDKDLTLRAVAIDLVYAQALTEAAGRLPDEKTPVVYDIETVSER